MLCKILVYVVNNILFANDIANKIKQKLENINVVVI